MWSYECTACDEVRSGYETAAEADENALEHMMHDHYWVIAEEKE